MIPKVQSKVVLPSGTPTPEWYAFFRSLVAGGGDDLTARVERLEREVAELEDGESLTMEGLGSVVVTRSGDLVTFMLSGDSLSPGGNWYYGTNAEGVKGFWPVADGVGAAHSISKAVDYGPYDFQGELDSAGELPQPAVVGDAYLIDGDLWVGVDDGIYGLGWDNTGPAVTKAVLALENDEATPAPLAYYGTGPDGARGFHPLPRSGVLPVVTGEVSGGQPVFVYADDGSLIYTEIA